MKIKTEQINVKMKKILPNRKNMKKYQKHRKILKI